MNITNITDYDKITSNKYTDCKKITSVNCTNIENEDLNIIFKYLLLSIPSKILLNSSKSLNVYTLINNK